MWFVAHRRIPALIMPLLVLYNCAQGAIAVDILSREKVLLLMMRYGYTIYQPTRFLRISISCYSLPEGFDKVGEEQIHV